MIDILYRDDDLLVVDKPAGLVTHRGGMTNESDVAMIRARDAIGQYVWPIHRLDRGTSGALVFALSEDAARSLRGSFDDGSVRKVYLAIARGLVPEAVRVDHPIPRAEGGERVPAVTDIRRLGANEVASLVEAQPRTGRFHQVRRHLSHLRHPIGNDSNYGTGWFNRWIRSETGLMRLALHARSITLPTRAGLRTVVAPLPADLDTALERLGLASLVGD